MRLNWRIFSAIVLAMGSFWPGSGSSDEAHIPANLSFNSLGQDVSTADWAEILDRGPIRALVAYDKTNFLIVNGRIRGFEHDLLKGFEEWVNAERESGSPPVTVVFKPVPSSELLSALESGQGDLVAAGLTITPARESRIAFSRPYLTEIDEVLVSRLDRPPAATPDGLIGKDIHVLRGSSYAEHLATIKAELESAGGRTFTAIEADASLGAEDLLEMVNGGLIDFTVVDRHKAELWSRVMTNLRIEGELLANEGGEISWAVRKDNPELLARINRFMETVGTEHVEALRANYARYFESERWVSRRESVLLSPAVQELTRHFETYSERYGMDWLLMFAQGFQESRLDPNAVSPRGAIGVMQLLPSTGEDMGFSDITPAEPNIHAGIKYMNWILRRYFLDEGMTEQERILMALGAYNAGPNRIARLRRKAPEMGLDPNRWFGHMELVTMARVGMEPVLYVSNIYKYYLSYSLPMFQRSSPQQRKRDVATIQRALAEQGYPSGPVDGVVGRRTREAIRSYQRDHGLAIDGRPNHSLRRHLEPRRAKPQRADPSP